MHADNPQLASKCILLTGATGYVGGRLGLQLIAKGYRVRCLVRNAQKLRSRVWANHERVEIVEQDLNDPSGLVEAIEGCHAAYYLIHSMEAAGSAYAERDRRMAENFSRAAAHAGVERIIYLGGLGEQGKDLSQHLTSRREVESALRAGGVPLTVLRAAMIIGSGSASFEILRYLVERLPVMVTPRWVQTESQPIAIRNVLGYLVNALDVPETTGQILDIGGSEVLTYRRMMDIMAEELGLGPRFVIPVPVLTPKLSSLWIHLVTPLSARIARPLAEGLRNRVVCREDRAQQLMPQPLLSVREAIRLARQREEELNVETSWHSAGPVPGDPTWSGGNLFTDRREAHCKASPEDVYGAICGLGGRQGWYAANALWRFRGLLDKLIGGPGLVRGRRHPEELSYGDALDFWRVVRLEKNKRLKLLAEMKLPGEAVLDFEIIPETDGPGTRLVQTALFRPRGLLGLGYWYAVLPFHAFVFNGMLRGIRTQAEKAGAAHLGSPSVRQGQP